MEYQLSIVSYFDILGMKQLLAKNKNANDIAKILSLLRALSDPDEGSTEEWGWRFVNFSDLIVRAVPIMSEANKRYRIGLMYHEVTDICNVQANLIARGVLVRGALTVGNIAVEQNMIFGEGLVRAYLQESSKAKYPRIMIDQRLMDMFRSLYLLRRHAEFAEEWSYLRHYLCRDVDRVYFLDYLGYMSVEETPNKYAKFLALHKSVILDKRRSLRGDKRTREYRSRKEKVSWLMTYHNDHVQRATDPDFGNPALKRDELIIPDYLLF